MANMMPRVIPAVAPPLAGGTGAAEDVAALDEVLGRVAVVMELLVKVLVVVEVLWVVATTVAVDSYDAPELSGLVDDPTAELTVAVGAVLWGGLPAIGTLTVEVPMMT